MCERTHGTRAKRSDGCEQDDVDTFVFEAGMGRDAVQDFEVGLDRLDLAAFGFASAEDALATATQPGGRVSFDFGGGDELTLKGVALADLGADDLIL